MPLSENVSAFRVLTWYQPDIRYPEKCYYTAVVYTVATELRQRYYQYNVMQ